MVALSGLLHLGVVGSSRGFGLRRSTENSLIYYRPSRDLDPLCLQVEVDCVQHHAAQLMYLQRMTEAADRRLIG